MIINDADLRVDTWGGPPGNCGFRKGMWRGEYQGRKFKFYCSIPHACDLDTQGTLLRHHAKNWLHGMLTQPDYNKWWSGEWLS
jgi:hypothetical protein